MAFHLFIQPQTVLTLKNLTPALPQHTQPSNIVPSTPHRSSHVRHGVSSRTTNSTDPLLARRSADYHPNIWDYEFVESLASEYNYKNEICTGRAEKLKENVSCMFDGASGLPYSLKLIDTIQRLGLDYHFHDEIKSAIEKIYINCKDYKSDLTIEALKFRLFRQHGYEISQGVLKSFVEEANANRGGVKDFEGLLSLYEASFYAYKGEEILNEARKVTSKHLKNCLKERNDNRSRMSIFLEKVISHSLGLPLLCRVPRMEVRQHINMYEMKQDINATLLEFAKLDFNMVQATYHEDLKYVSRWWRDLALDEPLGFARNRLVECFLWSIGLNSEPKYRNVRRQITKIGYLLTVIDDVYDVYGSLDELKLFTKAVERWDINKVNNLPHYMKICFFALYNTVNETGYENLRNNINLDVMPYLKKSWGNICKAFLVEATWYYSGYIPTLEEYTNNAWISVGGPLLSIHAYCQLGDHENITKEALEHMNKNQSDLIRWSSMIFRFANDLATSKNELERGDAATSVQCYMHETGVSESVAREYMQHLISASWEKINTSLPSSQRVFSSSFINTVQNVARMGQYTYQFGDGHGIPNREAKDRIMSIIVKPIRV
ncbi:terpene synthase 10-like [Papaver somniferum]|uniref:terpene synthase 10-like n=1 Tax=Papaver somniferum TaxID=3469 RepID=UPI000E6F9B4D|nr:terpene synthase 10-like [Papaver somniferum]